MYLECFQELFLIVVVVLTSSFEHKNSLRTIEAQIVQKLKNNEARPKFTGSYKKKRVPFFSYRQLIVNDSFFTRLWRPS